MNARLKAYQAGKAAAALVKADVTQDKEPDAWRSRVFKRTDEKIVNKLKNVFMQLDEVKNCTFEPNTGSLNPVKAPEKIKANHGNVAHGENHQSAPGEFFEKQGINFSESDPKIFKLGLIKRCQRHMRDGDYDKGINVLYEGFSLDKVISEFMGSYIADDKREWHDPVLKNALQNIQKLDNDRFAVKVYKEEYAKYQEAKKKRERSQNNRSPSYGSGYNRDRSPEPMKPIEPKWQYDPMVPASEKDPETRKKQIRKELM